MLEVKSIEDLNDIIANNTEENINLDFKEARSLKKDDNSKKEISKDVSSFANSAGGTIIYGISEKDHHKANEYSFIDGRVLTKEWLDQVIQSTIVPKIHSIEILPIRVSDDISKSIYIVNIPQSNHAPHMANDKRYYKRYNFLSAPMEEYEVKNLYNRTIASTLSINCRNFILNGRFKPNDKFSNIDFIFDIIIRNDGNSPVGIYKAEIKYDENMSVGNPVNKYFNRRENGITYLSVNSEIPIFPTEEYNILSLSFQGIDFNKFKKLNSNPLIIKLYYSNEPTVIELNGDDILKQLNLFPINEYFNINRQ